MTGHTRRMFGLAAAFVLTAAGAQAQGHSQDKGHGKGKDARELRTEDRGQRDGVITRGDRDEDRGERGDRDRGEHHGRGADQRDVYGNGTRVPPGLAKKPGGMPPGQYKKRYGTQEGASVLGDILNRRGYHVVRTTSAGQSQYVYYRTPSGALRRAVVTPGNDQLGFSNVPGSLLREVLARLY